MTELAEELMRKLRYLEGLRFLAELVTYAALGILLVVVVYFLLASVSSLTEGFLSQARP